MNPSDIIQLSFKDLKEKKVRTALTVVMVVIGVASIVALVSLTAGIGASISSELSTLGPTTIIVSSFSSSGFSQATTTQIQSLPNVSTVTPVITGTATARYGNQNTSVSIYGIEPEDLQSVISSNVTLYQGSLFPDSVSPVVDVGYDLAFPSTATPSGSQVLTVGQPITLTLSGAGSRGSSSVTIPVVGIFSTLPASFIVNLNGGVVMSLSAAEVLLHRTSYNELLVKATNTSTVGPLANTITAIYGSTARITTTQELASTVSSIIGSISTLLVLIAGISLLVAAIGIMNIMLISVYERIHEIGIMKSVGFKNRNILMIFIVQALIIGFFGGIVGLVVGGGGAYTLSALISSASSSAATGSSTTVAAAPGGSGSFRGGAGAGGGAVFVGSPGGGASSSSSSSGLSFTPVFSLSTILTAIGVAMGVALIAGVYPAWRASKLEPIEALREL